MVLAVLVSAVIGLSAACGTPSATATSPSATAAAGGGSNARSGPAAGGASGTVTSVSTSGFTLSTSTGQQVTVTEASSTTYLYGTSPISAIAIATGEYVLVLGTTSGTTITATQVIVQPTGADGSAASSAAGDQDLNMAKTTRVVMPQLGESVHEGNRAIAQALGIPERTVASRLAVAKERLRVMLKHSYGPQAGIEEVGQPGLVAAAD